MGSSQSSYNPAREPLGFGGHYTENQYRSQMKSSQDSRNRAISQMCIPDSSVAKNALGHNDLARYKESLACNMASKGIILNGSGSA
jgi:hypothetical protein